MYVLTVANLKGGAGKTAAATNLATVLAESGLRTVLVDLDFQGDSTTSMGIALGADDLTVAQVLTDAVPVGNVVQRVAGSVDVLPAAPYLEEVQQGFTGTAAYDALLAALEACDADGWDLAVLDTRPDRSALMVAALRVADLVLAPVNAQDGNSAKAAGELLDYVDSLDEAPPTRFFMSRATPPRRKGWQRRRAESAIDEAGGERWGAALLDVRVPEDVKMHWATVGDPPITIAAPDSLGATAFRRLADSVRSYITAGE